MNTNWMILLGALFGALISVSATAHGNHSHGDSHAPADSQAVYFKDPRG